MLEPQSAQPKPTTLSHNDIGHPAPEPPSLSLSHLHLVLVSNRLPKCNDPYRHEPVEETNHLNKQSKRSSCTHLFRSQKHAAGTYLARALQVGSVGAHKLVRRNILHSLGHGDRSATGVARGLQQSERET